MNNRLSFPIVVVLILLTSLIACGSNKTNEKAEEIRNEFPQLEEVLTFLDEEIKTTPENAHFNIAKKTTGYYLQVINSELDKEEGEYLVWDAKKKEFIMPKIKNLKSVESYFPGYDQYEIDNYMRYNSLNGFDQTVRKGEYDFSLFSGYDGWSTDVIELLEGVEDLPLKDIENLARAYDSQANNCIHPGQSGTLPSFAKDYKELNYQKIEAERVKKFEELADKSLAAYDLIIQQDPNYDTYLIGNVQLKKANNCMNYYLILKSVKEDELANKYLEQAKYPKAFETIAKMYLDGCAKQSFLFTNGDSDTYPLWYVQEKMGYRTDVLVINQSLMAATWYLTMIQDVYSLKSSLSTQQCFDNKVFYFLPNPNIKSAELVPVEELFRAFNKYASKPQGSSPEVMDAGASYIMRNGNKTRYLNLTKNYYLTSELFLIDMIHNNPQYEVFFASPFSLKDFGWKRDYLKRLLVAELTTGDNLDQTDSISGVLLEHNLGNVTPEFLEGCGRFSSTILLHYYTYFQDVKRKDENKGIELASYFDQKIDNGIFYDQDELSNLEIKLHIQSVIDFQLLSEESARFFDAYIPIIEKMKFNDKNLKDNYELMRNVFSITRLISYSEKTNYNGLNDMANLLNEKLTEFENGGFEKRFKWQSRTYSSFRKDLDEFLATLD